MLSSDFESLAVPMAYISTGLQPPNALYVERNQACT
jgi:hypothetical protein